ncbi:MAG: hypothetical protein AB2L21_10865, partial [Anaerolineaceae bacterium]
NGNRPGIAKPTLLLQSQAFQYGLVFDIHKTSVPDSYLSKDVTELVSETAPAQQNDRVELENALVEFLGQALIEG